jgi:hypothetical protein
LEAKQVYVCFETTLGDTGSTSQYSLFSFTNEKITNEGEVRLVALYIQTEAAL